MRKILFSILVGFSFGVISCNDDVELNNKISNLQSELNSLTLENKSLFLKNFFLKKELDKVLIVDAIKGPLELSILFEDKDELKVEYNVIKDTRIDSLNWSIDFYFAKGDTVTVAFLGTNAKLKDAEVTINPNGNTPLSALLKLEMPVEGRLKIQVEGIDGEDSNVVNFFDSFNKKQEIPILGLYPNYNNRVTIYFTDKGGKVRAQNDIFIQTEEIPLDQLPSIEVNTVAMNFVNGYFLFDFRPTNNPMIIDKFGRVRWYLKNQFSTMYGLQRLKNGNICFGSPSLSAVVEYDMLGNKINQWVVNPAYNNIHHDVYELPNGNFLVTVNKTGSPTMEDVIVEIDRITGQTLTVWDLELILPKREYFISDTEDWFHNNAVIFDESDNSLIISGQRMGVVKVSWSNELIWILSQPEGWPAEYQSKLLMSDDPAFEWVWGQHAPLLMPNGNLFLFDNGFGRDYSNTEKFSRAAEFKITNIEPTGGKIDLVWEYGKERGEELYSPIISDVDYLIESHTRLLTFGSISYELNYLSKVSFPGFWSNDLVKAKIIEVDESKKVLFEMTLKSGASNGSVYRSEKLNSLYYQ